MKDCPSLFALSLPLIYRQIFSSALIVISVLVLLSNFTLIYLLHKTKQMKTITSKLIILLTSSDIISGVISYPCIVVIYFSSGETRNCNFELATQFIALLFAYFSFWILMGVAIDRYFHVTKLQSYNTYMNDFYFKLMVCFATFASLAIAIVSTVLSMSFWARIVVSSVNAVSLSSVCLLYMVVEKRIRNHANTNRSLTDGQEPNVMNKQLVRSMKTVRSLLIVLVLIYSPYTVSSCFWAYYKMQLNTQPGFVLDLIKTFSYLLTFSNAWINAIIYCYGNTKTCNYVRSRVSPQSELVTDTMS